MNDLKMSNNFIEALELKAEATFKTVKEILIKSGFESEKISEKIITCASSRSGAIVEEAENGGYSTIVIGRRGLSKVEAFFMGRVGHKVVYAGKKFTVWVV
jgi:nucleotide-binding universal stress UspA family protein